MIKSMTGFGAAQGETDSYKVSVEIKSLNSKFMDANLKLPKEFMGKDIELRNILGSVLERGKISFSIDLVLKESEISKSVINKLLVKKYYSELFSIADELNVPKDRLLDLVIQMPGVLDNTVVSEKADKEWLQIIAIVNKALSECNNFRNDEGKLLKQKFKEYILKIEDHLAIVIEQDPRRIANIRERIKNAFAEYTNKEMLDQNRFEQELIYYIEKLDISEEKVRLKSHLDYFDQALNSPDTSGKKLGFIAQEIGREINTIGSKANDAIIQKLVVEMKEELEKIKEQVMNIL